jgi:hypothetical protein
MRVHSEQNEKYFFSFFSAVAIGALLFWSWQQWVSLTTDAGHNLYTFWKLSEGKKLYRDLSYFHGPLSPWIESFLFWIFGVSVRTLALTGVVVVWVIVNLIYNLFRHLFDHSTALAASLFFLFVFAFSQYVITENYNYLAPYKFESVHGILLGLAAFACAQRALKSGATRLFFLVGLCLGCSLLTATEIIFANFTAMAAFFLLAGRRLNHPKSVAAWLAAGIFLPCLLAWIILFTYLPAAEAFTALFSAIIVPLKGSSIAQNKFYLRTLGLDNWRENLASQGQAALLAAFCGGILLLADRYTRRLSPKMVLGVGALISALIVAVAFLTEAGLAFFWHTPNLLPLAGFVAAAAYAFKWVKQGFTLPDREILCATWVVWSIALLTKIILYPRFSHYGFYLSMPSALLLIGLITYVIPEKAKQAWSGGSLFRAVAFAATFSTALVYFSESQRTYSVKTFHVGYGDDAIATVHPKLLPRHAVNWLALDWIEKNIPADATLLTLPEGSIFNYLARRNRPGPYTMNVVEMLSVGESRILEVWMRNPPDFVALVQNESAEFGFPPFGTSATYGKATMDWVNANYVEVKLIGLRPFLSPSLADYGIQILKRR